MRTWTGIKIVPGIKDSPRKGVASDVDKGTHRVFMNRFKLFPLWSLDRERPYRISAAKLCKGPPSLNPFQDMFNGCKLDATLILTCTGRTVVPVIRTVPIAVVQVSATQQAVQQLSMVQLALVHGIHRVQESCHGLSRWRRVVVVVVAVQGSLLWRRTGRLWCDYRDLSVHWKRRRGGNDD